MRLAIVTTHPIQYYAPVFKLLHQRGNVDINVYYTLGETATTKFDKGFNKNITWDIPLLVGYPFELVKNTSKNPSSAGFYGVVNPGIIQQIKTWQPDAVLVYGWAYHSHIRVMRYFKNKVPVLFRGDSTLIDEPGILKKTLRNLLLKWVYSHIDHALYAGTQNKAYFKKFGIKDSQLTFIPHAVDNSRFAALRTDEVNSLRQQLNIPDNDIVVLFAGKFEDKKDPLILLNAFLQLKQPGLHLLFVGNGELESVLKQQAAQLANIHFIDFQNQSYMPVIYQACDLFCLPSKGPGETWGLAVNEAMACKKAILVSDKTGCAVDLVDEKNGAVFKSTDLNALTEKLSMLVSSKHLLTVMGNASAQKIINWNFVTQVINIENSLKKINAHTGTY